MLQCKDRRMAFRRAAHALKLETSGDGNANAPRSQLGAPDHADH